MKGNSHGVAAGHLRHAAAGLLAATAITLTAAGAAAAAPPNFTHDWHAGPPRWGPGGPPHGVPVGPPSPTLPEETTVPPGCTSTLTGPVNGPVVVPSGQRYCLVQAQVEGGATVLPGAGIVVQDSRVDGGVRAEGANYVRVCDSIVNGPIVAHGGTKFVMIGDADDDGTPACGPNFVHGPVALLHNQAGVELGGDSITGPVFVIGNEGPAFEGTDVGAEIEANQ